MMEGRAPSRALVPVFAKQKELLAEIYSAVQWRTVPINDDIRGVFDRLLATPEQIADWTAERNRTVIAQKRSPGPSPTDVHETGPAPTQTPQLRTAAHPEPRKERDFLANMTERRTLPDMGAGQPRDRAQSRSEKQQQSPNQQMKPAQLRPDQRMTKLLYSSETVGCGATMKLESGEICIVSVAQSGVSVKSNRGKFAQLLAGLFGAVLYREKNVYKAAETAMALDMLFPQKGIPVAFRNPVLNAFANAVWQCSTAAEVAITPNEAIARGEAQAESDDRIVSDLADLMARGETIPGAFYDVSVLPHPKAAILQAIEREILREPSDVRVDFLGVGAAFLLNFQEGIGSKPLFWLGVDLTELRRTTPDLMEQARLIAHNPDAEKAQHFLAIRETETTQIEARIDAAVRSRNDRIGHFALDPHDPLSGKKSDPEAAVAKVKSEAGAYANYTVGVMCRDGQGVRQDYAEAARRFRLAADQGYAIAQEALGSMYYQGQGVPQDYAAAVSWFRKAADRGYAKGQHNLGVMYANGQGVAQDYAAAASWI